MTDLGSMSNLESYKELIDKFKSLDIVTKELTLFDVGARGHFENPTTELLSFFLDSGKSHGLDNCFFNGLQEVITSKDIRLSLGSLESVETEVSTAKGNRIDLLLETDEALIIVECKIYHQQNNPFDDYTSYGMQSIKDSKKDDEQGKALVKLVLCLDGRTDNVIKNNGWHGISYQELVATIELYLSKALLDNPYNKWGLFAREFLLHLKELDNVGEISKDELEFLTVNFKDFTKLNAYIHDNLMPKIGEKIKTNLNKSDLESFTCKQKPGKWNSYEPVRKFSNTNWKTLSDISLWITTHEGATSYQIRIYIANQSDYLTKKFKDLLQEPFISKKRSEWYEVSNTYWAIAWDFDEFEIEVASRNIVELMRCLNELELNHRSLILE